MCFCPLVTRKRRISTGKSQSVFHDRRFLLAAWNCTIATIPHFLFHVDFFTLESNYNIPELESTRIAEEKSFNGLRLTAFSGPHAPHSIRKIGRLFRDPYFFYFDFACVSNRTRYKRNPGLETPVRFPVHALVGDLSSSGNFAG